MKASWLKCVAAAAVVGVASVALAESPKASSTGGTDEAGATIKGVIKFEGKQAARRPIRMEADRYCTQAHPSSPALEERYIFGDNDTLVNVFVWVSKGLEGKTYNPPAAIAILDQEGCVYHPHVSGVMTSQTVEILNNDATLHNVNMKSSNNGSFNIGMPVKGMKETKKFSKPEAGMKFACDVHPWMAAYMHVVEHPFFAVTGQDGTFTLKGLPPGEYELSVWHEMAAFVPDQPTVKVTVGEGETKEVTVTYAPRARK